MCGYLRAGVEWAVHAPLNLSWAGGDQPVSAATLASGHDHPPAYLNKQVQRLVKAGLLISEPGAQGGFRLARGLESITLLDVVDARSTPDTREAATQNQDVYRLD
ncbi:RrF2 family transcriptional regulator [Mycobacterium sp. URHB0021]